MSKNCCAYKKQGKWDKISINLSDVVTDDLEIKSTALRMFLWFV